jgi:menaquinone-9 beta-reductase
VIAVQTQFDALIIGAGPAGSAAAILLARAGFSVALVEKQAFPRRKVCGECIAASNLPLLQALGIGAALDARAGPELRQVALLHGTRAVLAALPAARDSRHAWGRALGRETLDMLLLEQARSAGAQVLQPCSAQAFKGVPGAWTCEIRALEATHSSVLHARLAIAANGSWEPLPADHPGAGRPHRRSDLLAFKANFRGAAIDAGVLPVLALDGGYGGMVLAGDGLATVACCVRRDRLAGLRRAAPGARAGDVIEAWLMRECSGARRALRTAARVGPWLAAGPLDPGIRTGTAAEPFRIGNAAGEAHPILGEGMSMALQSAGLLCARLIGGRSRACLGDPAWQLAVHRGYAGDWQRHFMPRLRLAAVFAHAAMRPGAAALAMAVARAWPGLLGLGARCGGKVDIAGDPRTFD